MNEEGIQIEEIIYEGLQSMKEGLRKMNLMKKITEIIILGENLQIKETNKTGVKS